MTSSSACCVAYLPCFECYACSPVNRISHDTFAVVIADIEDQETRTDKNLMVLSMGEHPCFSSCIRNDLGVTFDIKSLSKRWRINKPWIWKANAQNSAMYESIGQAFTTDIEKWPATIAQDSDAPKSHLERHGERQLCVLEQIINANKKNILSEHKFTTIPLTRPP